MELTREYFDKKFAEQAESFVAKEYFDDKFSTLVTKIDSVSEEVGVIKEDISEIKTDVGDLKTVYKSMELDLKDVKEIVNKIDKRDLEDSNLLAKSYVDHDNRLKVIEKTLGIKKIKTA